MPAEQVTGEPGGEDGWDPSGMDTGHRRPSPLHRASKAALERRLTDLVPTCDPAALCLFIYTQAVGRHGDVLISKLMRADQLDAAQFSILMTLWCVDRPYRLAPSQLSRLLCQSPPGTTHTLSRLESRGLVRRVRDDADARARYVELTSAGVDKVRQCGAALARELEDVFAMSPTGLDALAGAQRRIAERLSLWDAER